MLPPVNCVCQPGGPKLGSCLTLRNELSKETHVLTKQEILPCGVGAGPPLWSQPPPLGQERRGRQGLRMSWVGRVEGPGALCSLAANRKGVPERPLRITLRGLISQWARQAGKPKER